MGRFRLPQQVRDLLVTQRGEPVNQVSVFVQGVDLLRALHARAPTRSHAAEHATDAKEPKS
jgi:hypothetical protein